LKEKICVVIPTYNERENVKTLIPKIFETAESEGLDLEVLVVDDSSPDGTGDLVEEMARENPKVHLVRRLGKLGLGSAYKDGFRKAINDFGARILVEMDADGSHDPRFLPKIVGKLSEGYDVVVGSRYVEGGAIKGWGLKRRLISSTANLLARWLCGVKVKDATSGYRAFKAEALKRLDLEKVSSSGYAFQVETLFWAEKANLKIGETPIIFVDRVKEKSKLGPGEIVKFASLCLRLALRRLKG